MFCKFLLVFLLVVSSIFAQGTPVKYAQIDVIVSPVSMGSLYPLIHTKRVGIHTVRFCNVSPVVLKIPEEKIYMPLMQQNLPILPVASAISIIGIDYQKNWKLQIIKYGEYGLILSSFFVSGGLIAVSPSVISSIGLGTATAHLIGDKLKKEVPDFNPIIRDVLQGTTQLNSQGTEGQCATRIIFTSIIPKDKLKVYQMTIQIPVNQ